jgi:molybdopterin-guanine dinucleotide biosynthesis protein A
MARPLPMGFVLAGGLGRRLGRAKATAQLCGRPLISYPVATLQAVLDEVVVLAKPQTELPPLAGAPVWVERESRQHPLVGIVEALSLAGGRPVLVCAVDLPLVSPAFVRDLAFAAPESAPAVIASHGGAIQPLLGRYTTGALEPLRAADPGIALRDAVGALRPELLEVSDPTELLNINTRADLERAAALLCGPDAGPPSTKQRALPSDSQ